MRSLFKLSYNAPVTLTFVLLSLLVFGLSIFTQGASTILLFCVYPSPLSDPFAYFRLFGHVLGSAGYDHFLNNAMFLLLLGPMIEEKYGGQKLLLMILFTAFVTGIISVLFTDYALLGASGIVFMMILLSSFVNLKKGRLPVTFLLIMVIFIGREIYDGIYQGN